MTKGGPKKLIDLSKEEQLEFFDSFDTVYADVDGVLCDQGNQEIEGAPEGIAALRNLRKKCYFITNNSTIPLKIFLHHQMKKYNIAEEEVIRPTTAVIWYLQNINFDKEIYVVGSQAFKEEIKKAGFKVVVDTVAPIPETRDSLVEVIKSIRPNVGAVAIDFSLNVSFVILQKCVEYITRNNALFLVGAWDPVIPFGNTNLIGSSAFAKGVQEASGRKPIILAKPGEEFSNLIVKKLAPSDPKRVLFIGDSAVTDMALATNSGYQKLLPLSGFTTEDELKDWKYDETWKPDYYVDSIKDFDTIVKKLGLNNNNLGHI